MYRVLGGIEMDDKIFELISIEYQIKGLKKELKALEEKETEIKECVVSKMECEQLSLFENEEIKIKRIEPQLRISIDIEALKEEMPDVYEKYKIVRNVKESVRITLKGGK